MEFPVGPTHLSSATFVLLREFLAPSSFRRQIKQRGMREWKARPVDLKGDVGWSDEDHS